VLRAPLDGLGQWRPAEGRHEPNEKRARKVSPNRRWLKVTLTLDNEEVDRGLMRVLPGKSFLTPAGKQRESTKYGSPSGAASRHSLTHKGGL